jgi:predicted house-cleaning noncanonical NTP pyrophosphatase (MazG superfamily)
MLADQLEGVMTEEDEEFERISNKNKLKGIKVMSADEFRDMLRNETLEEVAMEFDKLKNFGDTSQSFARFVRNMKK